MAQCQPARSANPNQNSDALVYDLIVRNASLEDFETPVDIGITAGVIQSVRSKISARGREEIDAGGYFASPLLIDPHAHLDKCFLQPVPNHSGTLPEAIQIMNRFKGEVLLADFSARVDSALTMALRNGTGCIRTHVDIDVTNRLKPLEAMLNARRRWSPWIELQVVAFPQEGILSHPDMRALLRDALQLGADAIGGIPAIEDTPRLAEEHIEQVFTIAADFNCPVDMHIDESDDPRARTLEMLARATLRTGWAQQVSAAHCCSLAAQRDDYARRVIDLVNQARITIITNPTANLALQGRRDRQPVRRGITRVKELVAAGVNVVCGHDNLRDSFYPFGQADMLEVAFVTSLASHMTGEEEIRSVMAMPRHNAARMLNLKGYGIQSGSPANLMILPVSSLAETLACRPPRQVVIKNGKVIVRSIVNTEWSAGIPVI